MKNRPNSWFSRFRKNYPLLSSVVVVLSVVLFFAAYFPFLLRLRGFEKNSEVFDVRFSQRRKEVVEVRNTMGEVVMEGPLRIQELDAKHMRYEVTFVP